MKSSVTIRNCNSGDADSVFRIICQLEGQNPVRKDFDSVFFSNLEKSDIFYIVAELDSRVIGFASMHIQQLLHHTGKVAEIQEMFIDPAYRSTGYGEEMFWHLRDIAETEGCGHFEVSCNIIREKTHTFFSNMGMQTTHYKFTERL